MLAADRMIIMMQTNFRKPPNNLIQQFYYISIKCQHVLVLYIYVLKYLYNYGFPERATYQPK